MKSIVFTQDFDGQLPIFKDKKMGEKMEVNESHAAAVIHRGVAELDTTGGVEGDAVIITYKQESAELDEVEQEQEIVEKELKDPIKTKEEKHKVKAK